MHHPFGISRSTRWKLSSHGQNGFLKCLRHSYFTLNNGYLQHLRQTYFSLNLWPILGLSGVERLKIRTSFFLSLNFLPKFPLQWWNFNFSLALLYLSYNSSSKTPKLIFPIIPYFLHTLRIYSKFLPCIPSIDEVESITSSIFYKIWLASFWMKVFIQHNFSLSTFLWLICWLLKLNTFISSVILLKESYNTPFWQLMKAFVVARNGLPRMISIEFIPFHSGLESSIMKSIGQ